jgi:predicted alpha/beta hydrolase family esterase
MKQALILQGWYQKPDSNWYPWLAEQLQQRGYTVFVPDLPTVHTDLPDWKAIEQAIHDTVEIDGDTVIIGHSLGCVMALRLAEKMSYKKMILVAGWDFNDLTHELLLFWEKPLDHAKIREHVKEIICVGSENDPDFTFDTTESMSKRLAGKALMVKGAGHFTEKFGVTQIPQLLDLFDE